MPFLIDNRRLFSSAEEVGICAAQRDAEDALRSAMQNPHISLECALQVWQLEAVERLVHYTHFGAWGLVSAVADVMRKLVDRCRELDRGLHIDGDMREEEKGYR